MEINDLTRVQRLSVPCPVCAAAPQERCCEIYNGAFRQDEHFSRLLAAAGQEAIVRPAISTIPRHPLAAIQ